jgi:hypothetical protein
MYSLVNVGEDIEVGSVFMVQTPVKWNKSKEGYVEIWTIDGPKLQRLIFINGVEDEKPLFPPHWKSKEKDLPLFRKDMTFLEIKEFIESSLTRGGAHQLSTRDFRPATLASLEGFRFEFSYSIETGLEYDGFIVGAKRKESLVGIMYVGTALYHYSKHLRDAEEVISSATLL